MPPGPAATKDEETPFRSFLQELSGGSSKQIDMKKVTVQQGCAEQEILFSAKPLILWKKAMFIILLPENKILPQKRGVAYDA